MKSPGPQSAEGRPGPVLLTGASGFIGRHLGQRLRAQGYLVRGLTRGANPIPGIETYRYSGFEDRAGIARAAEGAAAVVHLAARVHVMEDYGPDAEAAYRAANVVGTRIVMDEAIRGGARLAILMSSVKAVGEESGERPLDEDTIARPVDPYGRSKLEAENEFTDRGRRAGIAAVVLRLPLVYGPGMGGNMHKLFEAVRRGVPLPLGSIRNRRSLLYVHNLTAAVAAILAHPTPPSGVYFLSDGHDLCSADLVRAVAAGYSRNPRLLPVPEWALKALGLVGDFALKVGPFPFSSAHRARLTGSLQISSERFRRVFAFTPPYHAEQALGATARAHSESETGLYSVPQGDAPPASSP